MEKHLIYSEIKCHYCSNKAVQYVSWLKNKRGQAVQCGQIKLPHCGCDLYSALTRFWSWPIDIFENVDYKILPLEY